MQRYSLIVVTDETKPIRRFDVAQAHAGARAPGRGPGGAPAHLRAGRLRARADEPRGAAAPARRDGGAARAASRASTPPCPRSSRGSRVWRNSSARSAPSRTSRARPPPAARTSKRSAAARAAISEAGLHGASRARTTRSRPRSQRRAIAVPRQGGGAAGRGPAREGGERVSLLRLEAERLGHVAAGQELSLGELIAQLEDKHHHLVSSPAIWPTKGWLTSRFGNRISPFTGLRQFHSGIDIAGEHGHAGDRARARPRQLRRRQGPPRQDDRARAWLRRAHALRAQQRDHRAGRPGGRRAAR